MGIYNYINNENMKLAAIALIAGVSALEQKSSFAPPALGPYASDIDHLSTECYGADEDDIMYDVFERYRVEEKNPDGHGTGIWKLPKSSSPQWSHDIIHRFHVMDDDKVDAYIAANIDNFWKKYDNNGTGEIYESEGETFMRALLGPNNRFRLAPGALSDMNSAAQIHVNQFGGLPGDFTKGKFAWRSPMAADGLPESADPTKPVEEWNN